VSDASTILIASRDEKSWFRVVELWGLVLLLGWES
jgi:hypothetical protein